MVPPRAPSFAAATPQPSGASRPAEPAFGDRSQRQIDRATLTRLGEVAQSVEHTAENRGAYRGGTHGSPAGPLLRRGDPSAIPSLPAGRAGLRRSITATD